VKATGGRFLKRDSNVGNFTDYFGQHDGTGWYELDMERALSKTSQAFREFNTPNKVKGSVRNNATATSKNRRSSGGQRNKAAPRHYQLKHGAAARKPPVPTNENHNNAGYAGDEISNKKSESTTTIITMNDLLGPATTVTTTMMSIPRIDSMPALPAGSYIPSRCLVTDGHEISNKKSESTTTIITMNDLLGPTATTSSSTTTTIPRLDSMPALPAGSYIPSRCPRRTNSSSSSSSTVAHAEIYKIISPELNGGNQDIEFAGESFWLEDVLLSNAQYDGFGEVSTDPVATTTSSSSLASSSTSSQGLSLDEVQSDPHVVVPL